MKKFLCLAVSLAILLAAAACSTAPVTQAEDTAAAVSGQSSASQSAAPDATSAASLAPDSARPAEIGVPAKPPEPEGGAGGPDIMHILTEAKTTQYATADPVKEEDLTVILAAGLNAPSAVNAQPWHFSVVTNEEALSKIAQDTLAVRPYKDLTKLNVWNAPVAVVVSGTDNLATDAFDCGLACEAMSVTAQVLGYGTKIVAHPCLALNGENQAEYKALLSIPADHTALALLLIGVPDEGYDALSSASVRYDFDKMVSYVR